MSDQADHTPDPIDVAVGQRIRVRRTALGVTQSALADHLGMSFQQVQKYERGTNRVSASVLVRIAAYLETTVSALVGEDAAPSPPPDALSEFLHSAGGLRLAEAAMDLPPRALNALIAMARELSAAIAETKR